jgi:Arc/MetJ-type ribon-helix-helix transcriptional regulator
LKTIQVEIPEKLAQAIESIVKAGWCKSEAEVVRLALLEFVRSHRLELMEGFQRDDIAWALQQATKRE